MTMHESEKFSITDPVPPEKKQENKVKELYEKRADYYDAISETARRRHSLREFFSQDDSLPGPGSRILDAGCGTGIVTQSLVEVLDQKKIDDVALYGFDLTPAMLAKFDEWKVKHHRSDIQLREANVLTLDQNLPKDWKDFDLVVSANMLEHIPREQLSQALKNLRLLLNEKGKLTVFIESNSAINRTLVKWVWGSETYSKDQLVSAFREAGFKTPKIEKFGGRLFRCFAVVAESEKNNLSSPEKT